MFNNHIYNASMFNSGDIEGGPDMTWQTLDSLLQTVGAIDSGTKHTGDIHTPVIGGAEVAGEANVVGDLSGASHHELALSGETDRLGALDGATKKSGGFSGETDRKGYVEGRSDN